MSFGKRCEDCGGIAAIHRVAIKRKLPTHSRFIREAIIECWAWFCGACYMRRAPWRS